jgi:hypothetical protein
LTGFSVEALDGSIGKIDEASNEVGSSYLVVDTGPWIFGKKVMLPAGVVRDVDLDTQTIFVNRTKDEIKDAPEFDQDRLSRRHLPARPRRLLRSRRRGLPRRLQLVPLMPARGSRRFGGGSSAGYVAHPRVVGPRNTQ